MNRNNRKPLSTPELPPGMNALAPIHNSMSGDANLNSNVCRIEPISNADFQAGINDIDKPAHPDGVMFDQGSVAPSVTVTDFLFYPDSAEACYPLNPVVQAVNDFAVPIFQFRSGKLLNDCGTTFLSDKTGVIDPTPISFFLPFKAGTIDQPKRERQDQNNSDQNNDKLVSGHTNTGLSAKGNKVSAAVCRACNWTELRSAGLNAFNLLRKQQIKV